MPTTLVFLGLLEQMPQCLGGGRRCLCPLLPDMLLQARLALHMSEHKAGLALLSLFLSADRHKWASVRASGSRASQGARKPGWGDLELRGFCRRRVWGEG